jgi:hypothetical protein
MKQCVYLQRFASDGETQESHHLLSLDMLASLHIFPAIIESSELEGVIIVGGSELYSSYVVEKEDPESASDRCSFTIDYGRRYLEL